MQILPSTKQKNSVITKTNDTTIKELTKKYYNLEKENLSFNETYCKISTKNTIKFCNNDFIASSGYSADELLNKSYDLITHPKMPEVIRVLINHRLQKKQAIIAITKNATKDGSFFWTKSHYKPNTSDTNLQIAFSVKSKPISQKAKKEIEKLYNTLLKIEKNIDVTTASKYLFGFLEYKKMSYSTFISKITE